MITFVLVLILILVLTGGHSGQRTPPQRPPRRSWGADLNDQARNRLDQSNPVANNIRRGWDNQS